jgi:hypothetical protein
MNINATLIVQAFNFLIAYVLLRIGLFKPAVALIQAEYERQNQLRIMITHNHEGITQKEQARYEQWLLYHEFYLKNRPPLEMLRAPIFKNITPSLTYPVFSPEFINSLVKKSAQTISEKVER